MKAYIVFWVDGAMTMSVEDLAYRTLAAASEAAKSLGHEMCLTHMDANKEEERTVNVWEQWVGTGPSFQFTINTLYVCDVFVKEIDIA
jgi:hypothetical protein